MSRTAKEIETTGLPCEAQNGETIQVVPKVDVTMFGKFTLKQEGMEVPHAVSLTGRSRRLWTLTAYLILHRDRGVSAQELNHLHAFQFLDNQLHLPLKLLKFVLHLNL